MNAKTTYDLTWDLDSLLPHPESTAFRELLDEFRGDLTELARQSDLLPAVACDTKTVDVWVRFLNDYQAVSARMSDLDSFIGCHAAADADNKEFQRFEGELTSLSPLRERVATNVQFSLREAGDELFAEFVQSAPALSELAFFLEDSRRYARLRLPKQQELLAAELDVDGRHAWGRLYDRISGELRIAVMERGELVRKSPGQVQFDSPERSVRQNNYFAAEHAWQEIDETCAEALNHISGSRLTRYRRLEVRDHLHVPLEHNRMRRETLETMWAVITERKPMLLEYLQAKAAVLGLEQLTWYDLQAPLPQPAGGRRSEELAYETACQLIIGTFGEFDSDFGAFAERALTERWIEAENRSGKRQGGFCTGFPTKKQSRIFMTYTNSPDSMSTLAHELGHAYHSFVLKDRPLFLRRYPMNLAETASTFAEAVLGERQLESAGSAAGGLTILDNMLSDAVAFLMNIHARFLFEDAFHQERQAGELSASRFTELMLAAQREAYLNGLADDGWNPTFWISKLHFYISTMPFYNFPYTFGYLLSLGLYALAEEGDGQFPEQYRRLLIATGCQTAEEAVQSSFGHDLTQPEFWHRSLDVVESRVRRFVKAAAGDA